MLPLVNGKNLMECKEEDLAVLIDNQEFRENEYIDYKKTFAFLEIEKGKDNKNALNSKKAEFKVDVCSFANADGGYLLYGVSEENGCVTAIDGIEIVDDDIDKFELERRNDLSGIQPTTPDIRFSFVKLKTGKYVVILQVNHNWHAPYVYIEDQRNYRIYRRYGNKKDIMPYNELRMMFNQALSFEKELNNYVKKRVEYYRSRGSSFGNSFINICMIPETFMDVNYRQNVFVLEQMKKLHAGNLFDPFHCYSYSIPCVDGIRFISYEGDDNAEGYIRNNGIVEACLALDKHLNKNRKEHPNGFLPYVWLWNIIDRFFDRYIELLKEFKICNRIFVSLSLVGCQNVSTETEEYLHNGIIDRDEIYCESIELNNNGKPEEMKKATRKLYLNFLLAIGVKHDKRVKALIDELYGNDEKE